MPESGRMQLAVLIDAENLAANHADHLFAEVAKRGKAHIRRIYGDFTLASLKPWTDAIFRHSLVAQQQFSIASGKNSSDIMLVIDAMDLLHGGGLDGFFIASSDSDFSRLAQRIREAGLKVIGFGSSTAQVSLQQSCHEFISIAPRPKVADNPVKPAKGKPARPAVPPKDHKSGEKLLDEARDLICRAIGACCQDGGWMSVAELGKHLHKSHPGFSTKKYGSATLGKLVKRIGELETVEKEPAKICFRIKNTTSKTD
jgi:uncharacterized LabA/DUF88 family protein